MPLYSYECPECKLEFDEMVKLAEFDTKTIYCPTCKCTNCKGYGGFMAGHNSSDSLDCWACGGSGRVIAKRKLTPLRSTSSSWRHWRLDS